MESKGSRTPDNYERNWISQVSTDLEGDLDWYLSRYNCNFNSGHLNDGLPTIDLHLEYEWKSSRDDKSLIIITINLENKNDKNLIRFIDEIGYFFEHRITLFKNKDFILIFRDKENRYRICSDGVVDMYPDLLLNRLNHLIATCENEKIALKIFYSCDSLGKQQIFTNGMWIK